MADPRPVGAIGSIRRFPVKSMLGEELAECALGPAGLAGDRAYALVDLSDGTVASAKHPRRWGALLDFRATFTAEPAPGEAPPPVTITFPDGSQLRSDDPDVDAALSRALGREVSLTAAAPAGGTLLEVWPDVAGLAPEEFIAATTTGRDDDGPVSTITFGLGAPPGTFFDVSPVHVLTTATLTRLSELGDGGTFDVRRYRPNLLIDTGGSGFVENGWVGHALGLGGEASLGVALATMRCVMTTLPQEDLPRDPGTLRTIAAHNRVEIEGLGRWACAGVYCDVAAPGTIRAGDAVTLA